MSLTIPEAISQIHKGLSSFADITYEDLMLVKDIVKIEELKTGDYFIRIGESSLKVAFMLKGLAKTYYVSDDGSEHISNFSKEGSFVGVYTDLLKNLPSSGYVEAVEDCTLLVMNYRDMLFVTKESLAWAHLLRKFAEGRFVFYSDKMRQIHLKSAQEKYEAFQLLHADIMHRLPLNQIATYLNITPATLSRLRNSSGKYKK